MSEQQVHTYQYGNAHLRYLLHLPPGFGKARGERWPLILFLHGAGERGSDIDLVKQHGVARIAEEQPDFPFVTISPQCPPGSWWVNLIEPLHGLLQQVLAAHDHIDTDRLYLTGISMGGYGAWHIAVTYPDLFAAVVPICGGGDPDTVCAIRHVPVWAFHGALDNVVLIRESRKMVDALKACDGRVRFTTYPRGGHDVWTAAYNKPELYEWLLSHQRGEAVTKA